MKWIVTNWQLIAFLSSLLAAVYTRFLPALPPVIEGWIDKVGGEQAVIKFMEEAVKMGVSSNEVKKAFVIGEIQDECIKLSGVKMPDSVANLIVEWVYSKVKPELDILTKL